VSTGSIADDPYLFDPLFERAVVFMCCSSPAFWQRIGKDLNPVCLESPLAKLVLDGCKLIAHGNSGKGPATPMLLMQRLRRLVTDGKVKLETIVEVGEYLTAAEDFGIPDEDVVVKELIPVVTRRLQGAAIELATSTFAVKGDMSKVASLLEASRNVGAAISGAETSRLEVDGFDVIEQVGYMTRLSCGVTEMDIATSGGMPRKSLGVFIGGAGDGKSQMLTTCLAEGVRRGLHCGGITLELPAAVQNARVYANLTGIEIDMIMENPQARAAAKAKIEKMAHRMGPCHIGDMPPHATTVKDLCEWIDQREQIVGRKMEVLVIDYADKMHAPNVKADNEYLAMRHVYEGIRRDIAVARDMWVWTASQAKRPNKDSGKRLDLNSVSDSLNKVRVADWVISLNAQDEGANMVFYMAKNRHGRSRFEVGPLPTDFARGRMVPISREF